MTDTVEYLVKRFNLDISGKPPTQIHNVNRTIMAQVLNELNFKEGVEVGVAEGNHAKVLCDNIPGVKLHAVDIWERYEGYREYRGTIDQYYLEAKEKLRSYNCNLIKKFSMDAVKEFGDRSLDFVYIDGAHDFKNVADDICEWSRKVRYGGIVFGHDFKRWLPGRSRYVVDVKDVVGAFCYAKSVYPWFELLNDIKDPTFGPDNHGWMFVRQNTDYLF